SRSLKSLQSSAEGFAKQGADTSAQGADMFRSVIPYVKALASGDQAALNVATMPERRRVIDQYDTARKSLTEFTPRGGGQATAMSNLAGKEAGDLSTLFANARQQGTAQALDIGKVLSSLGIDASKLSVETQQQIAQILQKQSEEKAGQW